MAKRKAAAAGITLAATVIGTAVGILAWRFPVDPGDRGTPSPAPSGSAAASDAAPETVDGWTRQLEEVDLGLWGDTAYDEDETESEGEQCGRVVVDFEGVDHVAEYGSFEFHEIGAVYFDEADLPAEVEHDISWTACVDETTGYTGYYLSSANGALMAVIEPGAQRGPGDCEAALANPVESFEAEGDLAGSGLAEGSTWCLLTADDTLVQGIVRSPDGSFTVSTWTR